MAMVGPMLYLGRVLPPPHRRPERSGHNSTVHAQCLQRKGKPQPGSLAQLGLPLPSRVQQPRSREHKLKRHGVGAL